MDTHEAITAVAATMISARIFLRSTPRERASSSESVRTLHFQRSKISTSVPARMTGMPSRSPFHVAPFRLPSSQ